MGKRFVEEERVVMFASVWRYLGFCCVVVVGTALLLPREPEVLFGGFLTLGALVLVLFQLEDRDV
jgi:hypothetical protein